MAPRGRGDGPSARALGLTASTAILFGLGLYLAGVLAIGIRAARRVHDDVDFVVAGRRLPLWLCTATLFATWFGGGTCVGAAGAAYREGLLGVIADPFGAALCLFIAGLFYVRPMRRLGLLTFSDYFRLRFGPLAEFLSAVCTIPPFLAWAGAQFVAFGFVVEALTGLDATTGILIGAGVVFVYTLSGGMWAVSLTDFVQAIVLIAGLAYLLPVAAAEAGGWQALREAVPAERVAFLPTGDWRAWAWYVEAWLIVGLGSIPSQDLMQRSLSARNETIAQQSAYLSGLGYLVVGAIPVALGVIGPLLIPHLGDPELILPEMAMRYLPPAGVALFCGALLSAIMSSADSALLAPVSVFSENLLKRWRPSIRGAAQLRALRWTLAAFVAISLAFALAFRNVYQLMLDSMALGLASLLAPFTLGLYWKRATGAAANASMLAGAAAWGAALAWRPEFPADLIGMGVSFAVMAGASCLGPRDRARGVV